MFRTTLLCSLLTASLALAFTQDGEGEATFDAKANVGLKIHGECKKVKVADDGKALTITIAIADIDTDNSLRNKHMSEDMHADKFPNVVLSVPLDKLKVPDSGKSVEAEVPGTFNIHGVSKEVTFKYKATCNATCEVEGSAALNLSDFGVKVRSYLGATVKPDITVGAKFKVKK
jgi:polyisoprenoid-binding protein YceI